MSLLITSSQSKVNTNSIGIERPEQYTNHLRGALQIKPNSQIAIDSVKINRDPMLDFQDSTTSMFWFGERLVTTKADSMDDSTSWPIVQENKIDSSVSVADFRDQYRDMLKEAYCYHPEINTSSTQNGSFIRKKSLGTGILDGFEFQFQQVTDAPTVANIPNGQDVTVFGQADYDHTNGSITAQADDTLFLGACEGATNGPISLNNGSVTFNVSETRTAGGDADTRQFAVGLTRSYDHTKAVPDPQRAYGRIGNSIGMAEEGGLGKDKDVFFDYAAEGKDGKLRLYHYVRDSDYVGSGGKGRLEEIIYYQKANTADAANNGKNSSFATGSALNIAEVQEITFNCQNEKLKVEITGDNFNGSVVIDVVQTDSASFVRQLPKPINQACWKMYPQAYMYEAGDEISITDYGQRTGTTMNTNRFFGEADWQARCSQRYYTSDPYKSVKSERVPWQFSVGWPMKIEQRPWAMMTKSTSLPKNPYKGLDGGTMEDYENIFLVGRNERYLRGMPASRWQPNTARQLGMAPYTIFPIEASLISGLGSSFTSDTPPETSSQSSAFVRLPRFSHSTFNAGKGSLSKIVGMIPRFDNAGNETGALFFKEPDRLYVDLNNTDPINVTDISVDIVRRDETFVNDLTGSTEVVFHIREKPRM